MLVGREDRKTTNISGFKLQSVKEKGFYGLE